MRVFDLDESEEDVDIEVFIPGPPGPPRVDVGSVLMPVVVTGSIAAPVNRLQRSFISVAAPADQPTIPNPSDNGAWIWTIYVAPGSSPIFLDSASNIKLSGPWVAGPDSSIQLEWDGNSRYVEGGRNEI